VIEALVRHLHEKKLCASTDRILLAVSSGIDSMVMMHLFASAGFSTGVAHCNFQLRGKDSDNDEAFVEKQSKSLNLPFYVQRFETNNYATEHGGSIQMAARELRYSWFEEIRQREGFDFIATAHHLNDSIETIIFNLAHGRGLDGLVGIAAKNGRVIRPLLFASRKEIEKYAADHQIIWREDGSNQTEDYKRNFIRHQIIPKLTELNPVLEEGISRSIKKNEGILELEKAGLALLESQMEKRAGKTVSISKSLIQKFENAGSTLYQLLKKFGFSLEQSEQIFSALNGQSGKSFFSNSHLLVVDRDDLIVSENTEMLNSIIITKEQSVSHLNGWQMELVFTTDLTFNSEAISLDADKLTFPLTWRLWREGDFFYPLGMNNKKKISDFLIDNKIPITEKKKISVLESGDEIVWVVGHRISEHFKLTSQTRRAARFTLTPHFI
jgi:tRNA(Ile)-lysidine synthase